MKIALHDNCICVRGTTVAIYDYAYFLKEKYNYDCIIIYNQTRTENDKDVYAKFAKHFPIYSYENPSEIDNILLKEKCDYFFMIKGGLPDGIISNVCKNLVMAISAHVRQHHIHGDKFFVCSKWLKNLTGIDYVPHMINLPDVKENLRKELNIPDSAVVFVRTGGNDTFNLNFAKQAVINTLKQRTDCYFVFQNTDVFDQHERIIYLPSNPDLNYKVKLINTSDAFLHARDIGESFGIACGEFSIKNKPVITWNGSPERNHIEILGDKGLLYNNEHDLTNLLLNFQPNKNIDYNCYKEYEPLKVIKRFHDMYLA